MRDRMYGSTIATPCRSWRRPVAGGVLFYFFLNPQLVVGQEMGASPKILEAGDTIKLSVPGRPDLAAVLVLDSNGNTTIPQVGEVSLAGMSVPDATLFIKQKLRLFYPNLDTLHLEVVRSGASRIYVMGAVSRPGVQSFEEVPSLWDVLRSSGGPIANADLRNARVIREEDGVSRVHPLDLAGIMEGRTIPTFVMRNGDTLIIPTLLEGVSGVAPTKGVKVFGGVEIPTIVPIEDPQPMIDVLMLAGAPNELADIKVVWWVHEDDGTPISTLVNLEDYLQRGDPIGNPQVYPGDTIHVKYDDLGWFWTYVPRLFVLAASIITILLGYDRLIND
jgi:protein involved in polysaccharide export with SLBB domain